MNDDHHLLESSELVFAQDLNHRLTEHCGHGGEAEGEAGREDGPQAVHDEAVEAAEAVHGAQHHVHTADKDGGDTAEEELEEMMKGKIAPSHTYCDLIIPCT